MLDPASIRPLLRRLFLVVFVVGIGVLTVGVVLTVAGNLFGLPLLEFGAVGTAIGFGLWQRQKWAVLLGYGLFAVAVAYHVWDNFRFGLEKLDALAIGTALMGLLILTRVLAHLKRVHARLYRAKYGRNPPPDIDEELDGEPPYAAADYPDGRGKDEPHGRKPGLRNRDDDQAARK